MYRCTASTETEQMFLQDCSVSSDTVHDPTDTVQADTIAHVLNEFGGISVMGFQASKSVFNLNRHFLSFSFLRFL